MRGKAQWGINELFLYSFRRINEYSPTDVSKANERSVNRRNNVRFNPKATIDILSQGNPPEELDDDQKRELVQKYIEVGHCNYNIIVMLVLVKNQ